MHKVFSLWCLVWLVSVLGGALGCGPQDSSIVVTLANLPTRTERLQVTGTLDGKPAMVPQTVSLPLPKNQVLVQLPDVTSGHLVLDVQAFDADQCTQGKASFELDIHSGQQNHSAPIIGQSPRKCGSLAPCATGVACPISSSGTTNSIRSIWPIAPNDIWAVGTAATVLHYDGKSWTVTPPASLPVAATTQLNGVWASASDDVWAVGAAGQVMHYDGSKWTKSSIGATRTLQSISGVSKTSLWTIGLSSGGTTTGEFWHWNGVTWTAVTPFAKGDLYTVLAVNSNLVIVGGGDSNMNGILWVLDETGKFKDYSQSAPVTLQALWASSASRAVAVGVVSEILSFDGTKWTLSQNNGINDLRGVTNDGQFTYVAGKTGFVARSNDPALKTLTPITGLSASDLWSLQLASNGLIWLAGDNGVLGYLDTRP